MRQLGLLRALGRCHNRRFFPFLLPLKLPESDYVLRQGCTLVSNLRDENHRPFIARPEQLTVYYSSCLVPSASVKCTQSGVRLAVQPGPRIYLRKRCNPFSEHCPEQAGLRRSFFPGSVHHDFQVYAFIFSNKQEKKRESRTLGGFERRIVCVLIFFPV